MSDEILVIALGGNAISVPGEEGNIPQQYQHTHDTMAHVARLVAGGARRLVVTHGNGPQIGNILLRSELASSTLYPLPLDTCVADSQGGMGYMIQRVLSDCLRAVGCPVPVATVITQVVVDANDPAFADPTKPIGKFFTAQEAEVIRRDLGWRMKEDAGRGWRRVVASPRPREVIEKDAVRALLDAGVIVVAVGGGGIPVVRRADGTLEGVECVVDKDFASAVAGGDVGAGTLVILTGVPRVALHFGKPEQRELDRVGVEELRGYLAQGHFAPGSMRPKIEAAILFLERGGRRVIVTHPELVEEALAGHAGTRVTG